MPEKSEEDVEKRPSCRQWLRTVLSGGEGGRKGEGGREKPCGEEDTHKALMITYFCCPAGKIKICGEENLVLQEHICYSLQFRHKKLLIRF